MGTEQQVAQEYPGSDTNTVPKARQALLKMKDERDRLRGANTKLLEALEVALNEMRLAHSAHGCANRDAQSDVRAAIAEARGQEAGS